MSNWICIFDCEPIEEKTYIIHTECGTVTTGVWFYHKRKFMNSDIDGWIEEKVIDWMPLPKAP